MSHLTRLANSANSVLVKDMRIKLFDIENERDFRVVSETYVTCQEFNVHCQERREQMIEMQPFLHVLTILADSYNLLKELQDYELDKCRKLMKSISETQLKERLLVIQLGAKVFDKKGIDPTDYCIRFKLADSVPKQGDDKRVEYNTLMAINDVIGMAEEKLTTKEAHIEIMEAESTLFRVGDSVSPIMAMRLVSGQLANLNLVDLYDGLDYEVHLQFVFAGLKLIHTDNDVHLFFADAERSGKIHLYITHKQHDLGRYYLRNMVWVEEGVALRCSSLSPFSTRIKRKKSKTTKEGLRKKAKGEQKMVDDKHIAMLNEATNELPENYCVFEVNCDDVFNEYPLRCSLEEGLTILEGDGDMNKLYDIAEKKLDACSMSPHELVEWEQQEAGSPYLRTPHLKPRRKGIEFPCKNLFGDFLHCNSVADELVLDDNWKYEGLAIDDVGGSSKHCDLLHENVVYYDYHSLPNMDKERFSNNVVDVVVTETLVYTLPLVLKKELQ
ncbi:hypothetical protein Tco_1309795 [Tanacetum coccineum]